MDQHTLLLDYVKMVVSTDATSLVVKGNGGIGKSYSIMKQLDELGLEEGVHFVYIAGYMTPLQLYNTMSKSITLKAPKLLVFDDIDALVTNKISIALLKAALWEVKGKRVVSYHSSSPKVEGGGSFEFEGKVILILNDLKQEAAFGRPLLDRCTVFDMTLTPKQMIEYVDRILPDIRASVTQDERLEIWDKVRQFSDNPRFSVRTLIRAFEFYEYDKEKWESMFISSLKLDPEQKLYYSLRSNAKNKSKTQLAKEFAEQTGKSPRAWYRVKIKKP